MKKILNIISSASGENSKSSMLSASILNKLLVAYPDSIVEKIDLGTNPLPHLREPHVTASYTPENLQTEEQKRILKSSNESIKALKDADIIVIGVPMYNFSIPSTLKSWIDHIARAGHTFQYTATGPEGLLTNKKLYLAIASSGVYTEGNSKKYDHVENYLRDVFGFLGITDISVFRVEGTAMPELQDQAVPKALEAVQKFAF